MGQSHNLKENDVTKVRNVRNFWKTNTTIGFLVLELTYYFKVVYILLFLSSTNLYYILVKFEHSNFIIIPNIVDFVFLAPLQLQFGLIFCLFWHLESRNHYVTYWTVLFIILRRPSVLHFSEVWALQKRYFFHVSMFCVFSTIFFIRSRN